MREATQLGISWMKNDGVCCNLVQAFVDAKRHNEPLAAKVGDSKSQN